MSVSSMRRNDWRARRHPGFLLAIAHRRGLLSGEETWLAAHVDEDYNLELWGEVEEITTRRAKRRAEFDAAVRLLQLLAR